MAQLKTTIGLEIHVQLKTKSKMFCRCDNNAEGKAPNTVVCPVCLGLPGALPVANEEAVKWTIKTGLSIGSKIPRIAKFDRKHYFYPDLPKGYQISQYDEPFCVGGELVVDGKPVLFNRIHLEEDAGKLIHSEGKSLVDLNRAGTPLMEMVTEPVITSPNQAGDFLRRLQKLVRDEVKVSDADMEKGHLRCDANISISDDQGNMSEIVEIKNVNSFRFVEKALAIEEERLKNEYPNWPKNKKKVTRGYDSKSNTTYAQREKEEAADYRYFPEPDLPPFDTSVYDLEALRAEIAENAEALLARYLEAGVADQDAKVLVSNKSKRALYDGIVQYLDPDHIAILAKAVVNNYFPFESTDAKKYGEYAEGIKLLAQDKVTKAQFYEIAKLIHEESGTTFEQAHNKIGGGEQMDESAILETLNQILINNPKEVESYRAGKKQLIGFFIGQAMQELRGKVNPKKVNELITKLLN